ncbi:MAG: glycosyltransferase family 39 protein [Planctomycetota bacterium]
MPVPPDAAPAPPLDVATPDLAPRRRDAAAAFLLALVLLSAFAGVRDLWDADEGRYGTVALDMVRSGDYLTPREHGLRFMDKPPLVYWMACGAYAVLGPTPFAARLPCLVAGATLAMLAFLFAARLTGRRRAGFAAAIVVATSGAGMGFSRTVTMDMGLSAAVAGALYAGLRALSSPALGWRALLGLCVGAGLLVKGPLAAVASALVAFAWAAAGVSWKATLRTLFSPVAWAVALAVAAPWYVLMERANPGYVEHFVVYEHFRRFREPGHRDFAPAWLYAAVLPLFLVPWTLLLPRARVPDPVAAPTRRPVAGHRLLWAWVVVLLLLYSAGRNRLFTYALPIFLPLAVLCGARLATRVEDDLGAREARRGPWLAGAAVLLGGLAYAAAVLLGHDPAAAGDDAASPSPGVAPGLVAAAAGLVAVVLASRPGRTPRARLATLALAAAVLWWGIDLAAARFDVKRSPRALGATLAREAGPGDLVACLDLLPQGLRFAQPGLFVAVAGKQPEIVEPWASKDGAGRLLAREDVEAAWAGARRVVLVARAKKADDWLARRGGRVLARGLSGAQRSDLVVLENRPRAP